MSLRPASRVLASAVLAVACGLAVPAAAGLAAGGCDSTAGSRGAGAPDAGASPNASILPAPLATEAPELDASGPTDAGGGMLADPLGRLVSAEAGAPASPEPLRPDVDLAPEALGAKDLAGLSLEGLWRWRDVPPPPRAPEVATEGLKEAQKLTALAWKIDLTEAGRMRVEFASRALPLPAHAELRARVDRWGSLVLWPGAAAYRIVPPGALRTLIGERRVDVMPLSLGTLRPAGEGRRLGVAVRKVDLTSSLGTLRLELGKVPEAGDGGALLCRALVEIAGVDPRSSACQPGEVPLSAAYSWQEGGGVGFEVASLSKRTDLAPGDVLVPPPGAKHERSGLPIAAGGVFLTREELAAIRSAPLVLPARTDPNLPGEGFVAQNRSDMLMYLLVDGVPVVAVPPVSDRYVIGPPRGRYVVEWRTFLGDRIGAPQTIEMPARIVYGLAPDAGAPDGG
jgi:hypothetical protein